MVRGFYPPRFKEPGHFIPSVRILPYPLGEPADPPPTSPARAPPQTEFGFGAPADADPRSAAQSRDAVDVMPDWDAHIVD